MEKNQLVTVNVERLGINGEGVGYVEGLTLFVDGALPGEVVLAEVYDKRKSFARAKIRDIKSKSPYRVTPICPLFGSCGGCQTMHLSYPEQLLFKSQRVQDALERIGKFSTVKVEPCHPSPDPLHYRNKIQLPLKNGEFGLYAVNSHDLVPIEKCFIHCPLGEKVFTWVLNWHRRHPLPPSIRALLIRTAVHTGQVLVVFVTVEKEAPPLEVLSRDLLRDLPEVKGVVQNINRVETNTILGREFVTVGGQGWIEEVICGLHFKVSPASFFQVNPKQAEALYNQVVEFAGLSGKERVLDAYCGVGTLALILAKYAKEVVGVECVSDAIQDAKENGLRNQIGNAQFFCAAAEDFISEVKEVDVAVLNPPRKGCEGYFLQKLGELKPGVIVYVSCDPATLARDLAFLSSIGYRVDRVQPFDMFPQTAHVECVVKLVLL